jgi:hypothetical protein
VDWQDLVVGLVVAAAIRFLWTRLGAPRRKGKGDAFVPLRTIGRRDARRP